jgi:predicted NBD/HSP70 family sugar kinase
LARVTGLTPQALAGIISRLEKKGLIAREGKRYGGVGQPSTLYAIRAEGAFSLGIKIGRRTLDIILSDFNGKIRGRTQHEYEFPMPEQVFEWIEEDITALSDKVDKNLRQRIIGIGVVAPFFLGSWQEELGILHEQMSSWDDIDICREIETRFPYPIFFENDASAAAIAELVFGSGQRYDNFLHIFIGTFIGGGVILNGSFHPGVHGNAGAIASMPVPPSRLGTSGVQGGQYVQLLSRASLNALQCHLRANGAKIDSLSEMRDALNGTDGSRACVQEWMEDAAEAIAYAILSAISILDFEAVIIDGDLPHYLVGELIEIVRQRLSDIKAEGVIKPELILGAIGSNARALGGAILPFYSIYAPDREILVKQNTAEG